MTSCFIIGYNEYIICITGKHSMSIDLIKVVFNYNINVFAVLLCCAHCVINC